jgi:lipoprotein signal peptidase
MDIKNLFKYKGLYWCTIALLVALHFVFSFTLSSSATYNSGISFGIGAGEFNQSYLILLLVNSFVLLGLVYLIVKLYIKKDLVFELYLLIILFIAGLLNFYDRIVYNAVRDYVSVLGLDFNIPDVIIVFVAMIYIVSLLLRKEQNGK